jgi:hypothetical protein
MTWRNILRFLTDGLLRGNCTFQFSPGSVKLDKCDDQMINVLTTTGPPAQSNKDIRGQE